LSKRPRRAYLDTMVFIFGRLEECNSKLVLFLAQLGEFEVAVSQLVIDEVERFFRENFSREAGYLAKRFVETISTQVITRDEIRNEMEILRGKIHDKDLENVAAVRHAKIEYLVAYDEDYIKAGISEHITPKSFVKLFGLTPHEMEY